MEKSDKIFIAGHRGMVGSAITRALEARGFSNLIKRTRPELDLAVARAVAEFFQKEKPEVVIFGAAKVGGIKANNDFPVEFLIDKGYDPIYGARPMRRAVEKFLEDPLAEELLRGNIKAGNTLNVHAAPERLEFEVIQTEHSQPANA